MSLARAFTTRRAKVFGGGDSEGRPSRSNTIKGSIGGPVRSKISGPVELVHTTNMLSYNAPDIRKGPKISGPVELISTTNMLSYDAPDIQKEPKTATSNSSLSDGDSDHIPTAASSPPTSPDTAFYGGDKGDGDDDNKSLTLEPNHLSCYFTLPSSAATANAPAVPSIPTGSLSQSKSLERLNRKISISERLGRKSSSSRLSEQSSRSVSTKASATSRASSASTSTTASSHHSFGAHQMPKTSSLTPPPVPPTALSNSMVAAQPNKETATATESSHPFGHELAQVTELAEEYTAANIATKTHAVPTEEEKAMTSRGLQKFSPEEYVSEIQGLFATFFSEARQHAKASPVQWI